MSQPKRRNELLWTDEHGKAHRHAEWRPTRGTSLSNVPGRLVDAYCPNRHLTASLVANEDPSGDMPAIVLAHSAGIGPTPMLLLMPEGLYAAMVSGGRVTAMGTPSDSFVVDCPTCSEDYVLDAAKMLEAMSKPATRTRRIGLEPRPQAL